jgi:CPA2 family monovalent cation:H+ antiporter-2
MTAAGGPLPPLLTVGIVVTAIALAGAVAKRFGQSVIPAYILAGIVLGPSVPRHLGPIQLAVVDPSGYIDVFAELGVVALLFFLGLHVSVGELLSNRRAIVGSALLDLLLNYAAGFGLAILFGFSTLEALFVAGIVYMSSSAIITKSLIERGWIVEPESEPILGTLVAEDLLIAVYLTFLSSVVLGGDGLVDAALGVGRGFLLLGAVAVVGWRGTDLLDRFFASDSDELFLLRVFGIMALLAGVGLTLGVSEGVTAFFVGAALGPTDHAERIERVIDPARDLFAGLFFFGVGATTSLLALSSLAGFLAVALVVTTVTKLVSGTLGGKLYGLDSRRSFRVGVGLVARGEFSLVLAALAGSAAGDRLGSLVPEFAVGYVLVMSVLGTLLIRHEDDLLALGGRLIPGYPGPQVEGGGA